MRKSERLRLLEIQVARMEMTLQQFGGYISSLIEDKSAKIDSLENGKWYKPAKEQE